MDAVRVGFRRATAVSWALVGVGVVSVSATSALAYEDTAAAAAQATATDVLSQQRPPPVERRDVHSGSRSWPTRRNAARRARLLDVMA